MTTTATRAAGGTVFTRTNKIGFGLALLLAVIDLPSFLNSTPDGEPGPPFAVLILSSLCGLATIVAVVIGWRRLNWSAIRVAAGSRIVSALLAMPAFFVEGIEGWIRVVSAVFVLVTVVTVVLMLAPPRHKAASR